MRRQPLCCVCSGCAACDRASGGSSRQKVVLGFVLRNGGLVGGKNELPLEGWMKDEVDGEKR